MTSEERKTKEELRAELAALCGEVDRLRMLIERYERKEKILARKEAVLHATLESAANGILAVDENNRVVFSNKQFARMWHIPPDLIEAGDDNELLQFVLDQLVEPDAFLSKVRELYRSYRQSSDVLHFRDGRVFERYSHPLVMEEKLSGRVWTFRDISCLPSENGLEDDRSR